MSIQIFIYNILEFLNSSLVPFIFALAFLFFIWNMARYFIIGQGAEEAREKAKRNALYGIMAFVIMVSIWGIVNLFVFSIGLGTGQSLNPDYCDQFGGCESGTESASSYVFTGTGDNLSSGCSFGVVCYFTTDGVRECLYCNN